MARFHAARTAARKTPRFDSHMARNAAQRAAAPKRRPAAKYTTASYGHAVARATAADVEAGVDLDLQPAPWAPNQLRHAFATEVRKAHGLEAAQVPLGHARADVTQVNAEKNLALPLKVAAEVG